MTAFGLDVGGTSTRIAEVDSGGAVVASVRLATSSLAQAADPVSFLVDRFGELSARAVGVRLDRPPPVALGVALPGPLDSQRRSLLRSVNVPFLEGVPLAECLSQRLHIPAITVTDAEAATWAEHQACDPPPARMVHLRLGTGVAVGMVVDDRIVSLTRQGTGHLSVLVVDEGPRAPLCRCGRRGCLEAWVGGAALRSRAEARGLPGDLGRLQELTTEGDEAAQGFLAETGQALNRVLERLLAELAPDRLILGGGVWDALAALRASCGRVAGENRETIHDARLGDSAGVIGAALFALSCGEALTGGTHG